MKKIPSFTIDHIRLLRGIYVSRKDEVNGEVITTFDIRMKEPNREPALGQGALHTIEHLAATYLRNEPQWQDKIIYWGPMGCLTGNYLLMKGDLQPQDIVPLDCRIRSALLPDMRRSSRCCSAGLRQLPAPRPAHGKMGVCQVFA